MRSARWRSTITLTIAGMACIALVAAAAVPASASALTSTRGSAAASIVRPWCGIWWGSLAKTAGATDADWLMEGRVGRHRCYDRLVFELAGPEAGVKARYVHRVHVAPGARQPRGGARLQVRIPATLPPASATDGTVQSSLRPFGHRSMFDVGGFRTFRDVTWGRIDARGTTIGVGVRARLPFRVFVLDGPGNRSRVVLDVAHRW